MQRCHVLKSPNEDIVVNFKIKNSMQHSNCLFYNISYKNEELIYDSQLGLELMDMPGLMDNFEINNVSFASHSSEWSPLYGERSSIPDIYNEMNIEVKETEGLCRILTIRFRAYNEGVAFKYIIKEQESIKDFVITSENTQFHLPEDCMVYTEYGSEGKYEKINVSEMKENCERPLTVEYKSGKVISILEAKLTNYSSMLLSPVTENSNILVSSLSGIITGFEGHPDEVPPIAQDSCDNRVKGTTPFSTPWRVIIVGDKPGDLLERNYLQLNLNDSCEIENTTWIKPGKAIREVTLSTSGGKACVDFAIKNNFQYIEYDAGWYGHEYDDEGDATSVSLDPWRVRKIPNHTGLNLSELVEYAKKHGIGVWLYVNRRALERQLDQLLPLYKSWGIKGLKFGFVNVGPQKWTNWLLDAVKKCADYELLVDIHDAYRSTGFSRTYPNLLTQEGIRGNEHMPTARHNTTLPFTRYIAGAGDYTVCYYDKRIKTTHAHQLAMSVVAYSPLQFLFWYDKPSDYQGEAEVEFFKYIPTIWDETRVLCGKIGEYAVIARKSGNEWYIGCITNERERTLELNLDFLDKEMNYIANIYADASEHTNSRTNVATSKIDVDHTSKIIIHMAPSGGQAIRIIPINN